MTSTSECFINFIAIFSKLINIIHPNNLVTLYRASREESATVIWGNFKKLMVGESMNYGTTISYNIEHACIIDNEFLLLKGWSYAKDSYTKVLISNCGFFLDKIPSMLPREELFESNKLINHPGVGFLCYKRIGHQYDQYLKIELVSEYEVVELDVKIKHYDSLKEVIALTPEDELSWLDEILVS